MTSPADLLRALDKRLTAGPWESCDSLGNEPGRLLTCKESDGGLWCIAKFYSIDKDPTDIATLRNALPELAAVVELAKGLLNEVRIAQRQNPNSFQVDVVVLIDAALSALTEKLGV